MLNHGAILKAAITAALIVGMQLVDPTGALARQRERPTLNPQRTTFVGDNGELLRGPYTSTEWTNAVPYDEIARIRDLGFNAVHLYAEVFDPRYPAAGSTAPGYNRSEVDKIVEYTRDLGLYLVITIGNGANNGDHNRQWATDFWAFYAPRYADETHVIYEIHNEPVAWGPPYSSPTANPPGALDLNVELYNLIRSHAPETPVLLFSYSVLGEEGGARDALTDIHEFNRRVFGRENAVWTNEAIAFHGYAGPHNAAEAIEILLANGYPCFMTEFGTEPWGGGRHGLDIDGVAYWERMRVSWLTFQYIPPTGVSEAVTRPETFRDLVDHSGLSWRADYGNCRSCAACSATTSAVDRSRPSRQYALPVGAHRSGGFRLRGQGDRLQQQARGERRRVLPAR